MSHSQDGHYPIKTNNGKLFKGSLTISEQEGEGFSGQKLL